MYIWTKTHNEAAVATESKVFAAKLKKWAEGEGYRVSFARGDEKKLDPQQ